MLVQWLSLVTTVGQLALALLCFARTRVSPLALPLGALCLAMFGFRLAEWAYAISNVRGFSLLDVTLSSLAAPCALYFVLAFVGARRRLRWLLIALSVPFVLLALTCVAGFGSERAAAFVLSPLRGRIQAALIALLVLAGMVLLVRHQRLESSALEKIRTRVVIAALLVGGVLGIADLLRMHLPFPSMLVSTGLLAVAALRFKLFDRDPSRLAVVYAFAAAALAMLGCLVAFRALSGTVGVLAIALLLISAALAAAVWHLVTTLNARHAELERLALLGRFSAQIAHDLKNPLAALKGAAQVLQQERAQGRSIDGQDQLIGLFVSESERLARLVDRYERLGRFELTREPTDLNALVRRVCQLQGAAPSGGSVQIDLDLAAELPACDLDADLIATALENLLRNSVEALGEHRRVVVRTARSRDAPSIALSVEDEGAGMNRRQLEHAFDEFFTTKATGSGLGLPFVKRVAEAHGGSIRLDSREGAGTTATLVLPAKSA